MENLRIIIPALMVIGLCLTWQFFKSSQEVISPPFNTNEQRIYDETQQLVRLHSGMGWTRSGDWLASHPERGQSFNKYRNIDHIGLTEQRNVLYVQPIGDFDELQQKIVELSAEFLSLYFMCEVKIKEPIGMDSIPQKARRVHPSWGVRQIHTEYILDMLAPQTPEDAFATIAFTTSDLYPDENWNYVFGIAALKQRVGVWSLYRNGDPRTEFKTVLNRTLKLATHETGHMFTIQHCIAYNCNMCGRNNMGESDRRPIYMCPECLAKILLATGCDAKERFEGLKSFCERNQLDETAEFYESCLNILD